MDMPWIQTCSGQKFFFHDFSQYKFILLDFVQPLSFLCRFVGHIRKFYSVGEHCIHVARLLEARGYNPSTVWFGLIHDAGEAYIGDISRPLKLLVQDIIKPIEEKILESICMYYKVDMAQVDRDAVHEADLDMCVTEAVQLLNHSPIDDWHKTGKVLQSWFFPCWESNMVQREYHEVFEVLWGKTQ